MPIHIQPVSPSIETIFHPPTVRTTPRYYLHCFRQDTRWLEWGPPIPPNKVLDKSVRYLALRQVAVRVNTMRRVLEIPSRTPYVDEGRALSDGEFPTLEKLVAAAFAFNFMSVPVEQVGYFGRDVTSGVVLEKESDGEAVN